MAPPDPQIFITILYQRSFRSPNLYTPFGHLFPYWRAVSHVRRAVRTEPILMDFLMLAIGLGFFGLAAAYTAACDRL